MPQTVVALVEDLVFTSKLRAAAPAAGAKLHVATQVEPFLELIRSAAPTLILLDLNLARVDALTVVPQALVAANGCSAPVVGFLSHVQAERAQQALAAGCTAAVARSLFVHVLPSLLREGLSALTGVAEPDAPHAPTSS